MSDNIKTISDDELEKMAEEYGEPYVCPSVPTTRYCKHDVTCAFKAGFRKSESLRSVQWPSEEEVIAEAKSSTFKYIPNSIDYESGFVNCYAWIKDRVMTGK